MEVTAQSSETEIHHFESAAGNVRTHSKFLSIHNPRLRHAAISGMWNERCFWQPAHLIRLTLKKTEHLWQTGRWKIELWILIVEVNEQIGLEVCHLSVSRDALAWIHPVTSVSPVTSQRERHQVHEAAFWYFPICHQNVSGSTQKSCTSRDKSAIQTSLQAVF